MQFVGDDSVNLGSTADDLEILTVSNIKTKWGFLKCHQYSLQLYGVITQKQNPHEQWIIIKVWNLLYIIIIRNVMATERINYKPSC
jgi:hypothetical protein